MAWIKTLPANNSKIRLAPGYIRDNWQAIEDGLVPHKFVQMANAPGNPGAAPGWIYAKTNEIWLKSQTSGAMQITSGGFLGSASTNLLVGSARLTTISFDGGTTTNNQSNMVTAWSCVTVTAGAISAQVNLGLTASRVSTGLYKLTFSAGVVTNSDYVAVGTAHTSGGGSEASVLSIADDQPYTTTEFSIRIKHGTNDSSSDRSFNILVVGGR